MYVGRKHTTTSTAEKILTFRCPGCAKTARAAVVGIGQGQGNSAYFLDEDGAKERASSRAVSAADENAALTLSLARCPSCGRRNEKAITSLKVSAVAGGIAAAVFIIGLMWFVDLLKNSSFGIVIGLLLGPPTGIFIFWSQSWKWTTADRRVTFLED